MISLSRTLESRPVAASAPCRIDAGGTWDIKAMALPLQSLFPATVNTALTLRTRVVLKPFDPGWVSISSEGFPEIRRKPFASLPFTPPFGPFFAAVSHFGVHGLHVHIASAAPPRSGLGGSSVALVALIEALNIALGERRAPLTREALLLLAYHLEDAVSGGHCGLQDHAAAVYGGTHLWRWRYGTPSRPWEADPLPVRFGEGGTDPWLLVAHSGVAHTSHRTNRRWIQGFLSGKTRAGWIAANHLTHRLADALKASDVEEATSLIRQETALRRDLTPEALTPGTEALILEAEALGCGARFAGAGAGGAVWALGSRKDVQRLRPVWERRLAEVPGACLLPCGTDPEGVRREDPEVSQRPGGPEPLDTGKRTS